MTAAVLAHLEPYLRLGLTPIPLRARSKVPLVKWGNGWNPTSEELEAWARRPNLNWGARCGPEFAVLDFDSAEAFQDFIEAHPEGASWPRVKTSRGFHIWLRPKTPIRSQRVGDIEVKCLGSYIVAPPSVHPGGTPYVFEIAPDGALPEVDLEHLLDIASAPARRTKGPTTERRLDKPQQQAAEQILLEYLPGAQYVGRELAGYLAPDSESKAHIKVNLEKGVYMDWRKDQGGTVVELLRRIGAPVPSELGGMGEDDIPEYFPIWALGREYLDQWGCGELVVVMRRDGVPTWTGRAFCLRWSCPECAIRMKNILKRRLKRVKVTAVFRAPNGPVTPKVLAKVKRKYRGLTYLRVLGKSHYVLIKDAPPGASEALEGQGLELVKLGPSFEDVAGVVDEMPYANVRRRQRRLIASRGFWPTVGVSGKHSSAGGGDKEKTPECSSSNSDEAESDLVVIRSTYDEVTRKLRQRGFELVDVGLGESHRLVGQAQVAPEELGEVIEVIRIRKKPPPKPAPKGEQP